MKKAKVVLFISLLLLIIVIIFFVIEQSDNANKKVSIREQYQHELIGDK